MKSKYFIIRIVVALIPFAILFPEIKDSPDDAIGGNSGMTIPGLEIASIAILSLMLLFLLIESAERFANKSRDKAWFNILLVAISLILYLLFLEYFDLYI